MFKGRKVNVYVFGAGASAHLEAPLTKDFLREGFSLLCYPENEVSKEAFRLAAQLIDKLYGSQLEKYVKDPYSGYLRVPPVNIEELLSFVDLGRRRGEKWLPFKDLQSALYEFIFTTLEQKTHWYRADSVRIGENGTLDHRRNCYDKLIDYVMPIDDINCMISFNYDLFLDRAVVINNHGIRGDYHISFEHIENFPSYETLLSEGKREKDVDLLKLHGSLNWAYCPSCKEISLFFYQRYQDIFKKPCRKCKSQLEPILVPPVYFKDIPEPLANVWGVAENYLEQADRLIIIGYSFPDIDMEAKWLLKRAICKNKNKPSLTIVNPDENTQKRIVNFFGNSVDQNVTFYDNFEEYIDKNLP